MTVKVTDVNPPSATAAGLGGPGSAAPASPDLLAQAKADLAAQQANVAWLEADARAAKLASVGTDMKAIETTSVSQAKSLYEEAKVWAVRLSSGAGAGLLAFNVPGTSHTVQWSGILGAAGIFIANEIKDLFNPATGAGPVVVKKA